MLPARKFPPGNYLVWLLIKRSLRGHFDRIFFRMRSELTDEQRNLPLIAIANHSSWWDGYCAALVTRHLDVDGYLMMEEPQLRRYGFFRWAGCFSVDRHNARSAMHTLHYATHLLKARRNRMVWLFPQGEIAPNDRRPLIFYRGTTHLAKLTAPSLVYPMAIRIEYLAEQRPDLFISMGSPILISPQDSQQPDFLMRYTHHLETLVSNELDQLRTDVLASDYSSFTRIMQGRASTNRIFDTLLLRKQIQHQ